MSEIDKLLDHNYDGIEEYDNALPQWWVALFAITAIFCVYYIARYHVKLWGVEAGMLQHEKVAYDMAKLEELRTQVAAKKAADAPVVNEEMLLALVSNTEAIAQGAKVFEEKCVACHLAQGQGLVGPNLTDDYWIHGGKLMDIRQIIIDGVPAKGMLAWKGVISDEEINAVSAYVWTLHGTNPPNPKAPEGELVERS